MAKKNKTNETKNESFIEKLSKNETKKVLPKNRKFAYFVGASLITFVGLGIGIPVGFAFRETNVTIPPQLEDDLITFVDSNDNKVILTVEEFQNQFQLLSTETQQGNVQAIQNYFYQFLYQQEYNASIQYQEILNLTNPSSTGTITNINLKSLDEIIKEQSDDLNKQEQNIIDNNPAGIIRTTALQNLWKNSFSNALTHDQALQNSISNIIKVDALRRFNVSQIAPLNPSTNGKITSDGFNSFSVYDIQSRILQEDFIIKDKITVSANGKINFENGTTILKSGENPFNEFLKPEYYAIQNLQPNNSQFNENNDASQISLFTSSTFNIRKKNPLVNVENYLKNLNSQNVSTFTINATQNTSDASLPWNVTSEVLIKLFSYTINPDDNKPILNIELLKNWQGLKTSSNNVEKRKLDAQLLTNVSDNETKDNLGSFGIQDSLDLLNEQEAGLVLPLFNNIYVAIEINEKNQDPLSKLIAETNKRIFSRAGIDIEDINSFSPSTSLSEKINEANLKISNILGGQSGISNLTENDITTLGGLSFQKAFAINGDVQERIAESYLLDNGNMITFSSAGIHINAIQNISTTNEYLNAIKDDIQLNANSVFSSQQNIKFNTDNTFISLNAIQNINTNVNEQNILYQFLTTNTDEQDTFKEYLLLQNNTSLTTKSENFTNNDIDNAISTLKDFINSSNINRSVRVQSKITDYINNQISTNLKTNYEFSENQWIINMNTSKLDAISTVINTITEQATNFITLNSNTLNKNSNLLYEGSATDFNSIKFNQNIYNVNLEDNSTNFFDPNILEIKSVGFTNSNSDQKNLFTLTKNISNNSLGLQENEFILSVANEAILTQGIYTLTLESKIATQNFFNNENITEKAPSITKLFTYTIKIL